MRVLLLDPPGIKKATNLGLAYLGTYLAAQEHEVRILDLCNDDRRREERLGEALAWNPGVIGISVTTSSAYAESRMRELLQFCRNARKDACRYIAGGVGVTIGPREFIQRNRDLLDFAIIGEGEMTAAELLGCIASGSDFRKIPGIAYVEGNDVVVTEHRPFIKDLDSLPFPKYELFDTFRGAVPAYSLMTSRGCPYECIFCLNSVLSRRQWRKRSAENVVAEIVAARARYGVEYFEIWDDNFALDGHRAEAICELMIARAPGLRYTLPDGIRAASVTESLAIKLKQSGCAFVSVGVQEGTEDLYRHVKTGEKFEDIPRALTMLKGAGLQVFVSVIIGMPHSTYESTRRAMEFIERMQVRACWFLAIPFRGTEFYEWVRQHGTFVEDETSEAAFSFMRVVFETPEFTREERLKAYYQANMDYAFPELGPALYPYEVIFYEGDNAFARMFNSIRIVWRYNRKRILSHLVTVARRVIASAFRRARTRDLRIR